MSKCESLMTGRWNAFTRASLVFLFVGCEQGRVTTYPASGIVRFSDGQAVRFAVVEFHSATSGPSPHAKLDDDGRFQLGTFAVGDGAPIGDYRVIVVQHFDALPAAPGRPRGQVAPIAHDSDTHGDVRVAPEYADYATSPLRAKVEAGAENNFEFVVTRPRRKLPALPSK
jgi:hypothetical protein